MRCFQETCVLSQVKASWGWKGCLQWFDISLIPPGGNIQVPGGECVLGWQLMSIFKAPLPMAGDEKLCKFWHSEGWNNSKGSCPHRLRFLYLVWAFTDPYLMCLHTHRHREPFTPTCVWICMCMYTQTYMCLFTYADTANFFAPLKTSLSILVLCNRGNIVKLLSYILYFPLNLVPLKSSTSKAEHEWMVWSLA